MCASKKMMGGWAFAFINTVSLGLRVHYNMKDMECLDGCSSPCKCCTGFQQQNLKGLLIGEFWSCKLSFEIIN